MMTNTLIPAVFAVLAVLAVAIPAWSFAVPSEPAVKTGLSVESDGLEAVAESPTQITLYWMPEQAKGAESLAIYRSEQMIATVSASSGFCYYDSDLDPDTFYTYRIAPVFNRSPDLSQASAEVTEKTYPILQEGACFDVIIVGGTASGVAAARSAAAYGSKVALIEETNRLGGMSSNGLGRPDIRDRGIRANGFFQRMRERVIEYYGSGDGLAFEPRVANAVVKALLYEYPNISIFMKTEFTGVIREGECITGVSAKPLRPDGSDVTIYAPVVIDATIEGDVTAAAGACVRIGREPRSPEEPHNGHIYYDNQTDTILPGSTGRGDKKLQSYAYLLTVKDYGPGADRTIPQPPNYDKNNYIHSPEWMKSWAYTSGRLPNNKFEINQHPWGTDLPGINYDYPTASRSRRTDIEQRYKDHALGYLYYLQTEQGLKNIGLADDEYRDTCNFPPTLYVREARRVEGLRLMRESDVCRAREFVESQSIGVGDYPMDSHAVTNPPSPDVSHRGEGEWWLVKYTPWYHVPLDVIVPLGVRGLLVSSAISATHVAYGTLRMEPVRFSMGEAAGVTANMAAKLNIAPAEVPPALVQDRLTSLGVYLTWYRDVTPETPRFKAIQFVGVRGLVRDEFFRPDESITYREALEWIMYLARLEDRNLQCATASELDSRVTRTQFGEMLAQSGECDAAVQAFMDAGSPDDTLTRAEAVYGLYLAHRDYALGQRAFSERARFLEGKQQSIMKTDR